MAGVMIAVVVDVIKVCGMVFATTMVIMMMMGPGLELQGNIIVGFGDLRALCGRFICLQPSTIQYSHRVSLGGCLSVLHTCCLRLFRRALRDSAAYVSEQSLDDDISFASEWTRCDHGTDLGERAFPPVHGHLHVLTDALGHTATRNRANKA